MALQLYNPFLDDPYLPKFKLQKSANSWWTQRGKLTALLTGFKLGFNIKETCILAGISLDQYKYFVSKHPDFSTVKEACEMFPSMLAKNNIYNLLKKGDWRTTKWYAERCMPEEYGRRPEVCRFCHRDQMTGQVWGHHYS